jgi:hypothetical protein
VQESRATKAKEGTGTNQGCGSGSRSGFNGVSDSGFGIRIQGKEKEENEEKILTFILKFL